MFAQPVDCCIFNKLSSFKSSFSIAYKSIKKK